MKIEINYENEIKVRQEAMKLNMSPTAYVNYILKIVTIGTENAEQPVQIPAPAPVIKAKTKLKNYGDYVNDW
jgi:hypothetical protein